MTEAPPLSVASIAGLDGAAIPTYDREAARVGVVHLGLGAFARAHVARYCDDLLAAGHPEAGIRGVSLRSRTTIDHLAGQDGLYTLVEQDDGGVGLRVIGSVLEVAHGPIAAIEAIAAPATSAVTITVTEKGYGRRVGEGGLDPDHPDVAHDLARPDTPRSLPAVLLAGLRRRRAGGLDPPVVVSCDNLPANGAGLRRVVAETADHLGDGDGDWVREAVRFPSTVVDRMVPAPTDADRALVAERTGRADRAPVRSETFSQWVIEDVPGLPPWAEVGATLTADIRPWELLKLRVLNGSHTALALLGGLAGLETIAEAARWDELDRFVEAMTGREVIPTLPPVALDPVDYAASVRRRFTNPTIGHRTAQVAEDGSQKLPVRILPPLAEALRAGGEADRLALVVAAWMTRVARSATGGPTLGDPLAEELVARVRAAPADPAGLVDALLGVASVFPPDLARLPALRRLVQRGIESIEQEGAIGAAARLT